MRHSFSAALGLAVAVFTAAAWAGTTELVSVRPDGVQADHSSGEPSISADGRFVAFASGANNLVAGDTNRATDVFVHDRQTGTTELASVGRPYLCLGCPPRGAVVPANQTSSWPSISADGRFVAFASDATNLLSPFSPHDDTNRARDIFVHDRQTGTTELASIAPGGTQANGHSISPSISADGRFVAFASRATNLEAGNATNGDWHIFVHDRQTGRTELASIGRPVVCFGCLTVQADDDSYSPSISADGRFVAFASRATNLVAGDTNRVTDVFVRDRRTGTTELASIGPGGVQADDNSDFPSISADGRSVAFDSRATNLVAGDTNRARDIVVRDGQTGTTELASVGRPYLCLGCPPRGAIVPADGWSFNPSISADGRFVAFASDATNLVAGDTNRVTDVFVRDRRTGTTELASIGPGGVQADDNSDFPSISADGRSVAFDSRATKLVAADSNGYRDVFVRNR